jgi:hypothetical protein
MKEREQFAYDKALLRTSGFGLIVMGLGLMGLVLGTVRWEANAPIMVVSVVSGVPLIVLGLIRLNKLGKTGVQVVVDRTGITVAERGPDPIPWAEVERCELVRGGRGGDWLRLRLRAGSAAAARLGRVKIDIHDHFLTGGALGLRRAIARLASQVPRDW